MKRGEQEDVGERRNGEVEGGRGRRRTRWEAEDAAGWRKTGTQDQFSDSGLKLCEDQTDMRGLYFRK